MAKPTFPYTTRLAALRWFADGVPDNRNSSKHQVSANSIRGWAKAAGVKKNTPITDEELEAKLKDWAEKYQEDVAPLRKDLPTARRMKLEREDRKKFGEKALAQGNPLSLGADLMGPDDYKRAIDIHFNQTVARMDRATSVQDQANHMMAGLLLKQLRQTVDNLPPVTSWGDVKILMAEIRTTLGMNDKKGGPSKGVDLRILTGITKGRKVIEAQVVKKAKMPEPPPEEFEI